MDSNYWSRHGETPLGRAMWFPRTAPPARRGTDPERDEKFESGFLQRRVIYEPRGTTPQVMAASAPHMWRATPGPRMVVFFPQRRIGSSSKSGPPARSLVASGGSGFIVKYPDRVATLTLVCPTVLNPRSLAPLGARLMVLTGDHGLGARRVRIQNKYEFIGHIAREDPIYTSIAYSEPSITIAGNNAIVRHRESIEAHSRGKRYLLEFGVLRVWQKQDDQWRLLARQGWKPEIS